ncbi:MAG TPA: alpha-glucuronidase family glycosyl hydrolase [Verrucomicrobiae bacterium]|nr:alpha-glucuronidase family glycosyl hydrolase [Verrucomicrobiae bacterium]
MARTLLAPLFLITALCASAETGRDAWLRYAPIDPATARQYHDFPAVVFTPGNSAVLNSARDELVRGVHGMLGRTMRTESALPGENAVLLGTIEQIKLQLPGWEVPTNLSEDGWCATQVRHAGHHCLVITSQTDRGVLYGVFELLRKITLNQPLARWNEHQNPCAPVRMINQWDNLDGSIERGYAGKSIFWENGHIASDLTRVGDYARLMASVGINACAINNVNADPRVITTPYLPELKKVAAAFRPWGVRLVVCIDFSSPKKTGGLDSFDPLDPRVQEFWKSRAEEIYTQIPDFGGFVLKADSEGRLGPSAYGRTHADAANVIAHALKPHGGLLFYRGFVYDHHMDWRNPKNDRARAAYDNFAGLDGKFDQNVVIQIKNGPIDFQVREPASPLFGTLEKTSEAIELQITQEYTGQQRHLCYLVPMWKETLDFDLHARAAGGTPVKALVAENVFHQPHGGFIGVANVGRDTNWLGHHMAMANLYGFGRLAWNPDLSAGQIEAEWAELTFGSDRKVLETVKQMQLASWRVYEDYTGPLGAGGLTDIIGVHYGPGIESSERNGWGQWHRADQQGIGMDRTTATGTGFIGQYSPVVAGRYESLKTCPDELLLFFHHVPYGYRLHSGNTVIQHIYDTHYRGAAEVLDWVSQWKSLKGRVDDQRFEDVLASLEYQAGHAVVWRDAVCQWFLKQSGIPDKRGRAGHYTNRIEAEAMKLDGYESIAINPWETASGGRAVQCVVSNGTGSATVTWQGKPGWFNLHVQYFDENDGISRFRVLVSGQVVDQWDAADVLPSNLPNGHTSTRRTVRGVALRPGDEIQIEGRADAGERACLDYLEIEPAHE